MLEIYGDTSKGEDYNILFKEFSDVINEHKAVFLREDINGWDCGHVKVTIWYASFLWAVLYKMDYQSGLYSIEELSVKYKLSELRSCLKCLKIPADYLLELIGVDVDPPNVYGIERMSIENSFIVENAKCISPVEDNTGNLIGTVEGINLFNSLWESETNCSLLLNSNC